MSNIDSVFIPRGEMYVTRPGLKGERSFGNTPDFNFSVESETIDHWDFRTQIKNIDKSITLATTFSGSVTSDHVTEDNLSAFFNGSSSKVLQTAATAVVETLEDVRQGDHYQLGSATNVSGVRQVTNVLVGDGASETYVLGADYKLNAELGRVQILAGGSIENGTSITVTYDTEAVTRNQVVSGFEALSCSIRFISDNAGGLKRDFYIPNAELAANGDITLVGDEWQTVSFNIKALRQDGMEAIYADGRPYTG